MNYWKDFYKTHKVPKEPTPFAQFCAKRLPKGKLLDMGTGNGRDAYFFAKKGWNVVGYDPATKNKDALHCVFRGFEPDPGAFNIVYSRFLLHTIPSVPMFELIKDTTGYFVAEARAIGDTPRLYPDHYRYFINPNLLFKRLITEGFNVEYFEHGRGLAKYKNEDPLVIRVIAKRI
jgi:hypothetical protein